MPSKKKKYNARFPPGRIKKIMQTDEEVGKVAQAVPIIIYILSKVENLLKWEYSKGSTVDPLSEFFFLNYDTPRTLELFVESLLTKTVRITNARHAKTLSPSHMKQCIMSESRFDFLRELVKNVPDISVAEDVESSPPTVSDITEDALNGAASTRNGRMTKGDSWLKTYGRPVSMDFSQMGQNTLSAEGKCLTPNIVYTGSDNSSVIRYTASRTSREPPSDGRPLKMSRMETGFRSAPPCDTSIFSFDVRQNLSNPLVTSTVTSSTNVTRESVAAPPPVLKIDICNTPVVKIDYSHLPLSAPMPLPAAPAASELDEDYDNI